MKMALLLKLAQCLLKDKDSLWVRVMLAKYHMEDISRYDYLPRLNGADVWKSMRSI